MNFAAYSGDFDAFLRVNLMHFVFLNDGFYGSILINQYIYFCYGAIFAGIPVKQQNDTALFCLISIQFCSD